MATDTGPLNARPLDDAPTIDAPTMAASPHDDFPDPADKDDVDSCRICRGEGTPEEPLFYPCKCSGSIKYVHQECLMEWLSHTQKKHCELCKTSFRFTKLYHPGMPNRIPTAVFIRRAALHVVKMFVTWCRGILVGAVWLFLLPWCMRVVWRSLFWVGDGGWSQLEPEMRGLATRHPNAVRAALAAKKTNSTSPLSYSLQNATTSESALWSFARLLFGIPYTFGQFGQLDHAFMAENSTVSNTTSDPLGIRSPSLLSDVPFFNWFHSQAANRFILDVLEGQIITLLVVVAFILVFLIREWVVQQQPVINMVALGDNAAAQRAAIQEEHVEEDDAAEQDEFEAELDHVDAPDVEDARDHDETVLEEAGVAVNEPEVPEPTIRRIRRSSSLRKERDEIIKKLVEDGLSDEVKTMMQLGRSEAVFNEDGNLSTEFKESLKQTINAGKTRESEDNGEPSGHTFPARTSSLPHDSDLAQDVENSDSSSSSQRPKLPARDQSFIATEIRRSLEEGRALASDHVPQTPAPNSRMTKYVPESWEDDNDNPRFDEEPEASSDQEPDSEHSSGSWQQVPSNVVENGSDQVLEGERTHDKGKARAVESGPEEPVNSPPSAESNTANQSNEINVNTIIEVDNTSNQPQASESQEEQAGTTEVQQQMEEAQKQREKVQQQMEEIQRHLEEDQQQQEEAQQQMEEAQQQLEEAQRHLEEIQRHLEEAPAATDEAPPVNPLPAPDNALNRVLDWMFGDVAPAIQATEEAGNDEHIVRDEADEAPFVRFAANQPQDVDVAPAQDAEVAAAAAQAGIDVNDQEAIEDAEDLEGILELIGMQGPIIGLFQNALFSAVLISATIACAVWLPYLWGKVVILFMGSPVSLLIKLPLHIIATVTDLIVDFTLFVVAGATYCGSHIIRTTVTLCSWGKWSQAVEGPLHKVGAPAYSLAESAMTRIAKMFVNSPMSPRPDYLGLSVSSHAALRSLQNSTSFALNETTNFANGIIEEISADSPPRLVLRILSHLPSLIQNTFTTVYGQCSALVSWLWASKSYKITFNLDIGGPTTAAYTTMERWTASDRMIAIMAGYGFFAMAGAVYLKRGTPFSSSQQGQKIERIISDILQQAGGVLKVILIISIEMLAFPLYCGLLLDLAMLPLFNNATLYTRWQFAGQSPWTAGFVHWFIGTCYMFHFALFVSMCRKIMRKGVLYFIRDPDDPTFHPVRDVLERSVTTQLRKIAFSALVYGALVIVCLGGVVWTLSRATSNVLPIHWTTEAPSLEFPLDLLFYNFLTPIIIKFYKPSEGLHAVFKWCFQKCAGLLRLSNFLFGEKVPTQEGEDGRYVRAPASDQARIPKGQPVFVEVDQSNVRKDGITEGGVHNTDLVSMVFIPPWFRIRIFCFVVTIWVFMGLSGVSVTILPLLFGRYLFSLFLPPTVEMNDIHAFSLGIYTLGSIGYSAYHAGKFLSSLNRAVPDPMSTFQTIATTTTRIGGRALRFSYVWASLVFAIPFLFAVLLELYFLMPLHAYLGPKEPHVVHLIQDWTLGFLYSRLAARLVFANRNSRPARAFNAVVRDGYLYPNARIATRCFLIPILALFLVAIAIPSSLAWVTSRTLYHGASEVAKNKVWRFSFPAVGLSAVAIWAFGAMVRLLVRWRLVVRDEVYLIGERLHNFGERRAVGGEPVEAQT